MALYLKKTFFSSIITALFFTSFSAQTFQRTYDQSAFSSGTVACPTSDGGFLIGGNTSSIQYGPSKGLLIKTDASGSVTWAVSVGGGTGESIADIISTSDGNYAVVGTTFSFNAAPYGNVLLSKVSSSGTLIWTKMYGGPDYDYGHTVKETPDGGFIIAGLSSSFGAGGYDLYALRTDSAGNAQWSITIGGPSNDEAQQILFTPDGGYMLIGSSSSYSPNQIPYYEFAMCKLSAGGALQWMKKTGVGGYNLCYDAEKTADGGYVLAGWTDGFGQGMNDVLVLKTDSSGSVQWGYTYGGDSIDIAQDIEVLPSGDLLVSGMTKSFGTGNYDVYVLNLNAQGQLNWSSVYGGTDSDQGSHLAQTGANGYVITGVTKSFSAGGSDIYVIKCDSSGNSGCYQDDPATVGATPIPQTTTVSPAVISLWNTIPITPGLTPGATTSLLCMTSAVAEHRNPGTTISIYPNPAEDVVFISATEESIDNVEVFDLCGKKILSLAPVGSTQAQISLAGLLPGVYHVRVASKDYVQNERILKK